MEKCNFCSIYHKDKDEEIIFENDYVFVIHPLRPVSKGHILVVTKKHYQNIFDIDNPVLENAISTTKMFSQKILQNYHATGINILHASGKDAQQSIDHFHLHVIPRYSNDGLDLWIKEI